MTTIPTEAQNLLDAALEAVICRRKSATGYDTDKADKALSVAADAYRATQAPKDCRPPSSAKDGSLWWLTFEGVEAVARWDAGEWYLIGHDEPATPESLNTWTVHSEVKFGEPAGVVATDEAIMLFLRANGWYELDNVFRQIVLAAITHFRAPKLEISDEKIMDIARQLGQRAFKGHTQSDIDLVRAVIAKVGGEK